ncbi:MAG: hypothetical protein M1339_04430 [Bacteroidetes bacterium]|nr:hypothetical protein [Bacteroidota bacterium]
MGIGRWFLRVTANGRLFLACAIAGTLTTAEAQVHIKETVGINPAVKTASSIFDDPERPIYPDFGGTLIIRPVLPTATGYWQLHEATTGTMVEGADSLHPLVLQNIRQWTRLVLYMQYPGDTARYYPKVVGHLVDPNWLTDEYFAVSNCVDPWNGFCYDFYWQIQIIPDSSLDAVPPPEVLDVLGNGNPFQPQEMTAPASGRAYLRILGGSPSNQNDNLYAELPESRLLKANAPAAAGDSIDLGYVTCGEPLSFYITSGKPVVAGMKLYPNIETPLPPFFPGDGREIFETDLSFEDWTELYFDDLYCSLYIVSDTTDVVARVVPQTLMPGDTATVLLENHQNCGLTRFPPYKYFEVGITSGQQYGTILSNDGVTTGNYFSDLQEGFKFIAADSSQIDADSVTVGLRVGVASGGGGAPSAAARSGGGTVRVASYHGTVNNHYEPAPTSHSVLSPWSDRKERNVSSLPPTANSKIKKPNLVAVGPDFQYADFGTASVTIRREGTLITVSVDSPRQVWPTLNAASGGNPTERNVKYLTVSVTKGGQPASNYGVKIQASMILPSGGHYHTNQPPLDEIGEFEDCVNHVDGNGVITITTDANGLVKLAYTAPEFAGNVQVTATSTSENARAVDTISVKVPDLFLMNGGANLITYTSPAAASRHALANSDYGTPATNMLVLNAVKEYADYYGMEDDIFLAAIDMSLPWGGLFDIHGDWLPPHSLHRVGKSVDFSRFYRDASGKVISVDIYIDGTLRQTTNEVDQSLLDEDFSLFSFKRLEAPALIHYESKK